MEKIKKLTIYIDGASRGNPGQASFGVAFCNDRGEVFKTYSEAIGKATNNQAEYQGLIFAMKKAKALFGKDKVKGMAIEIRSDSELLVNQMTGKYKIKEPGIQKTFLEAWNLSIDFNALSFKAIPREQNSKADDLANQALDAQSKNQQLI